MAGIDKTYTDSYNDYKEFKDWADKQKLTFFNGHTVCVGDWVCDYEKEDFDRGERPIMNTPTWLDIYLIQNCKSNFVLDRMKSVYSEESYKEFQSIDLTSPPPVDFKQNRKKRWKIQNNVCTLLEVFITGLNGKLNVKNAIKMFVIYIQMTMLY